MSVAVTVAPASAAARLPDPIRVMIVDDSVVVRGLVARWIEEEADLKVVASVRTGRDAVEQLLRADPHVVLLDIEMPDLDGISALPLLLAKKRDLVVIMASTLTRRNAEISLKALSLGAADYIPKPASNREVTTSADFRRELVEKVRQLGRRRRAGATARARPAAAAAAAAPAAAAPIRLLPFAPTPPRVLLVGSSTGGPQALTALMSRLGPVAERFPVLITQHMPPTFTTILAEHLARASGRPAHEPADGEPIQAGTIYLAPGGRHMRIERRNGAAAIALDDGPQVNFCKPAVDPLFASGAAVYGGGVFAVILTGMGHDGTHGAEAVVASGGNVIAQDEATSVVWGMPGSAAHAGVCAAVLPLDQIAPRIVRQFIGEKS